jgi:hypothetical protein
MTALLDVSVATAVPEEALPVVLEVLRFPFAIVGLLIASIYDPCMGVTL